MARYIKRKSGRKAGLPPGSLIHIGEETGKVCYTLYQYDEVEFNVTEFENIDLCLTSVSQAKFTWLDISGLSDVGSIEKIGKHFSLHPLMLEDILNTDQRPKMEEYIENDHLFIILKMLFMHRTSRELVTEQVSLVIGKNYLLSFQEKPGDVFDSIRLRLRAGRKLIRSSGPGYLAYALADSIVDNYFKILEETGDLLEHYERELAEYQDKTILNRIHKVKRDLILIRKSVWPLREVLSKLEKDDMLHIPQLIRVYIRDLYDHSMQVIDAVETFRDVTSGLQDLYMTQVSYRMNEVIKILTIITTIFIPLTFIVGVYGMNFDYMPELRSRYGYFIVLGVMLLISIGMIIYFRRKKWL